ncbi:MAG: Calcium-transporting ATPase 1, partial [Frankiales bacterium]|nr:Calcium-transporting ATPase 1 [Frankiales bacterium]
RPALEEVTCVCTDPYALGGQHSRSGTPRPAGTCHPAIAGPGFSGHGLSEREAARRLERYGPNALTVGHGRTWPRALVRQFTQPLAVLLLLAAVLSVVAGTPSLAWAIVAVLLNAVFSFVQEQQAGRAVEALSRFLPPQAQVRRDAPAVGAGHRGRAWRCPGAGRG